MTEKERKLRQFAEKFGMKFYGTEEMKRDMARKTAKEVVAFEGYVGEDVACVLDKAVGSTEEQFFDEFMLKLDDYELDILATYLWEGHARCVFDAVLYQQAGSIQGLPDSAIKMWFYKKNPDEVKSWIGLAKMVDGKIYEIAESKVA